MTSLLFEPLTIGNFTFRNRVWLAPMCQYSAVDGVPNEWHLVHLGARASGGFGLVLTEATAVVPEGRISPADTGIWNDEQTREWKKTVDFIHSRGAAAGVQLAHAGRKASTPAPWDGHESIANDDGGWTTVAPSAVPFPGYKAPRELSLDEIKALPGLFADAARRSLEAGFDVVELHAAHGYLLHEFLSPLSNERTDEYGGSHENRARLLIETTRAVREVWSKDKPLFVRISATDWTEGGITVKESARTAALLKDAGADLIDVSTGGNVKAKIPVGPGYQVEAAATVRTGGLPVSAVGLITEPRQAEQILQDGKADAVMLAREALRDPNWPLRAQHELGVDPVSTPWPLQYERAAWQ
ncbi:NADH:flavin oxidoreductase/NADH oxidase [Arthrobacter roseus]|uniref:NADH:flavin oxidoreductase/NADH oxidase n=1 Tax=Arthrobacter roseus TaxID=136274 RepID=UPI0019653EFA|nr:NADH:flavin oxidoreductase/NADH oxidase [Arthrobacter roseus]MBM7847231.1 2,4-dienoyl-CoA reductase-like NADH-dependent reductase (Old Yellow Enzyme family) [Arthrobacter roseus]